MVEDLKTLGLTEHALQGTLKGSTPDKVRGIYKAYINSGYKVLAREYHPDINQSPDAEEQMKELNAARDRLLAVDLRAAPMPMPRPVQQPFVVFHGHMSNWSSTSTTATATDPFGASININMGGNWRRAW